MSVQRTTGARFRVVVHEPIRLAESGDRNADLEAAIRKVNGFMEERIVERPHEWWWVHKRWPNELYARGGAEAATAPSTNPAAADSTSPSASGGRG